MATQERTLADELCASRSVVRHALAFLKMERIIESFQGKGNRIVKRVKRSSSKTGRVRTIALLTPGSVEEVRPLVTLRIDDFRQQLMKENCQIQIIESKSCFKKRPERALATLRAHYSADCWVLRLSTRPMQEWFQANGIPTVVLGSRHAGIDLPFVDTDRRALSRHAVGMLIKAGHRRFALLISKESNGGDLENERGFNEAIEEAQKYYEGIRGEIVRHEESAEGVTSKIGKLLAQENRPTALFVAQPTYYLTVACDLARRGLRVPQDMSLITQVGGPYLSYMLPQPACYYVNPIKFSRKLLTVVLATIHRETIPSSQNVILPTYLPGASLGQIPLQRKTP